MTSLVNMVGVWDQDETDDWRYGQHYSYLELASKHVLRGYEPTAGDGDTFLDRLSKWVFNLPDGDLRKRLFKLTAEIHFVSQAELDASFRFAFDTLVPWWLIESLDLRLDDVALKPRLESALAETWFCGITDSLLIARFHHVNRLTDRDYRPDWRTLERFGDPQRVEEYMKENGLKRLVLLEDFIGSGIQAERAVQFAASLDFVESVLVVPLVICAPGYERLTEKLADHPRVTLEPIHVSRRLLREDPLADEPPHFVEFRDLVEATFVYLEESLASTDKFGFKGVGALTVLYSNCPNNTISLVHHGTSTWQPLFPRSVRK